MHENTVLMVCTNYTIQNTSRNKPLVLGLIGNKSDLEDERQVPTSKGAELATSVKATFGEVSAKTGHKVNEVNKKKRLKAIRTKMH